MARPIAHGQAMISTATAAVNAATAGCPAASQAISVTTATRDDDRHEHGGYPVGQPLHRRLPGLGLGDQPGQLGQLGVRADPGGPDHQPPVGVHARAGHGVARADLGRHRLTGEHRGVHRRAARGDDAVGGDLLAGPHHELLPRGQLLRRDSHLHAIAQHRGFAWRPATAAPAAPPPNAAWRGPRDTGRAGPAPSPRKRPRGRSRSAPVPRASQAKLIRRPGLTGGTEEQRVQRPQVSGGHAQVDQGVHGRRAVPGIDQRCTVERPGSPDRDRRGQHQGRPTASSGTAEPGPWPARRPGPPGPRDTSSRGRSRAASSAAGFRRRPRTRPAGGRAGRRCSRSVRPP